MKKIMLAICLLMVSHQSFAKATFVSKDEYVVGGLVGSIAGFGLGHAVQSRYKRTGWMFTAGEGIGLLAAHGIPGFMHESSSDAKHYISHAGKILFLGFRLWQIADLWVFTKPERAISASNLLTERSWQNGWWGAQREADLPHALTVPLFSW